MIKYAKLTLENKVESVILVDDMYHNDADAVGKLLVGKYVQVTDPYGNFVGNSTKIPQIGGEYINGYFVDLKPFPSWVFNNSTYQWDPPIPQPNPQDIWIEEDLSWYPLSLDYSMATPTSTYIPSTVTLTSLNSRLSGIEADEITDDATSTEIKNCLNTFTATYEESE
jgi:hypothetical protein